MWFILLFKTWCYHLHHFYWPTVFSWHLTDWSSLSVSYPLGWKIICTHIFHGINIGFEKSAIPYTAEKKSLKLHSCHFVAHKSIIFKFRNHLWCWGLPRGSAVYYCCIDNTNKFIQPGLGVNYPLILKLTLEKISRVKCSWNSSVVLL